MHGISDGRMLAFYLKKLRKDPKEQGSRSAADHYESKRDARTPPGHRSGQTAHTHMSQRSR